MFRRSTKILLPGAAFFCYVPALLSASGEAKTPGPYEQELKIQEILERPRQPSLPPAQPGAHKIPGIGPFLNLKKAVSYEDKNLSLMLHYLTVAKEMSGAELAGFWIQIYRARAWLTLGDYGKAGEALRKLVARKDLSPVRKVEIRILYLQNLLSSGQDKKYLADFQKFISGREKKSPYEEHFWHAALAAEKLGNYNLSLKYLEYLLQSYPIGQWSRKAFRKLMNLSCQKIPGRPAYYFSYKSLTRLGRNASIDRSLAGLLQAFSNQKIRMKHGIVRVPDPFERIEFLADARMNQDAYDSGLDLLRSLPEKLSEEEQKKKSELMILLGKIANRLYRHKEAVRHFSVTRSGTRTVPENIRVSEYLADSLSYGGYKEDASGLYGNIAQQTNKKLLRWHHFWNRYSSDDMEKAKSLLSAGKKRRQYVPPRDYLQPHGPSYWKARVLENLNRKEEALKEYQDILNRHSDDIYSNFITLRHPELTSRSIPDSGAEKMRRSQPGSQQFWSGEKTLAEHLASPEEFSPDFRPYILLYQAGLYDEIRKDISRLSPGKRSPRELAMISRLSGVTGAHHVQFKFAKKFILRTMPGKNNWFEITAHQDTNRPAWKAYYPVAYQKLISEVTDTLGVDPWFMLSVMRMESYYQEKARSWVGARGLMQIMPYTAVHIAKRLDHHAFRLEDLWYHRLNIVYGAWYLKILLNLYNSNPVLTAAAYNAGPFAVNAWIERCKTCEVDEFVESIPYRETRRYVKNILRSYARYLRIYEGRQKLNFAFELPAILAPDEGLF